MLGPAELVTRCPETSSKHPKTLHIHFQPSYSRKSVWIEISGFCQLIHRMTAHAVRTKPGALLCVKDFPNDQCSKNMCGLLAIFIFSLFNIFHPDQNWRQSTGFLHCLKLFRRHRYRTIEMKNNWFPKKVEFLEGQNTIAHQKNAILG